ncbi:hypothetical protein TKK_0018194 [Trichogramma kaykai]|uniref:Helicase ATP-binding domain-containing protein n=1 Tax=Trichogramma kaykai TaxID=54128 RepID=A0ABD2W131_9HYME
MAAKNRKRIGKDLSESSSSSDSEPVDKEIKKIKNTSYVKRQASKKTNKIKKVLDNICDEDSEEKIPKRMKLPIAKVKAVKQGIYTDTSSSSDSEPQTSKIKSSLTSQKKKSSKSQKLPAVIASKNLNNSRKKKHNELIRQSLTRSKMINDENSSQEFEKFKSKSKINNSTCVVDFSVIETPSKSDDENIPVSKKQEILLKSLILAGVGNIEKLTEDLKSDLEVQSEYLISKKINAIRDSKFVAHKILQVYNNTFQKLKQYRNDFANSYEKWIESCSNCKSTTKQKDLTKKKYNLSLSEDDDDDDDDNSNVSTFKKNESNKSYAQINELLDVGSSPKITVSSSLKKTIKSIESSSDSEPIIEPKSKLLSKTISNGSFAENKKEFTQVNDKKSKSVNRNISSTSSDSDTKTKKSKKMNNSEKCVLQSNDSLINEKSVVSNSTNNLNVLESLGLKNVEGVQDSKNENSAQSKLAKSTGEISEYDSDIFSGEDTQLKKQTENQNNASLKKKHDYSSEKDLFSTEESEVANTPVKSPILHDGNHTLRHALLSTNKYNSRKKVHLQKLKSGQIETIKQSEKSNHNETVKWIVDDFSETDDVDVEELSKNNSKHEEKLINLNKSNTSLKVLKNQRILKGAKTQNVTTKINPKIKVLCNSIEDIDAHPDKSTIHEKTSNEQIEIQGTITDEVGGHQFSMHKSNENKNSICEKSSESDSSEEEASNSSKLRMSIDVSEKENSMKEISSNDEFLSHDNSLKINKKQDNNGSKTHEEREDKSPSLSHSFQEKVKCVENNKSVKRSVADKYLSNENLSEETKNHNNSSMTKQITSTQNENKKIKCLLTNISSKHKSADEYSLLEKLSNEENKKNNDNEQVKEVIEKCSSKGNDSEKENDLRNQSTSQSNLSEESKTEYSSEPKTKSLSHSLENKDNVSKNSMCNNLIKNSRNKEDSSLELACDSENSSENELIRKKTSRNRVLSDNDSETSESKIENEMKSISKDDVDTSKSSKNTSIQKDNFSEKSIVENHLEGNHGNENSYIDEDDKNLSSPKSTKKTGPSNCGRVKGEIVKVKMSKPSILAQSTIISALENSSESENLNECDSSKQSFCTKEMSTKRNDSDGDVSKCSESSCSKINNMEFEEIKMKLLESCESDSNESVDSNASTIIDSKMKTRKKIESPKKFTSSKRSRSISSDSLSSPDDNSSRKVRRPPTRRRRLNEDDSTNSDDDFSKNSSKPKTCFTSATNHHYKADKKLRFCRVVLDRMTTTELKKYRRAIQASKSYLANKKLKSITNLSLLERPKSSKKSSKKQLYNVTIDKEDESLENSACNSGGHSMMSDVDLMEVEVPAIDDDQNDENNEVDDDDNDVDGNDVDDNDEKMSEGEIEAKNALLTDDSDSEQYDDANAEDIENNSDQSTNSKSNKTSKKRKEKIIEKNESSSSEKAAAEEIDRSDHTDSEDKGSWQEDELLQFKASGSKQDKSADKQNKKKIKNKKMSSSDQSNSPLKKNVKKGGRKKKKVIDSDSDVQLVSSEEEFQSKRDDSGDEKDSENDSKPTKKRRSKKRSKSSSSENSSGEKKPKGKRKRIKKVASDSESEDGDSPSKGRKNIRKVLKDKHVGEDTKRAAQDEEERMKRIAERQKIFNEMYDARLAGEAKVDKLVLDFDEETKQELVVVDKELVKRLKPHQAQGIKFMWDACFESLKMISESEGSGCIIAHCMGLGKTFQVVTLAHTLLSHEETGVKTVMVVCPLSTVLNWCNEFKIWLKHVKNSDDIEIYELTKQKKNTERRYMLESWQRTGGVLIIGYEMFRNLTSTGKKLRKAMQESLMRSLVDPGADLVVCDEGHLLKNEDSALSKAMNLVKTRRRIVLTGTPLQNNLKEYHCMVQFVKPSLLGTKKEFLNRFVNPITNGQFDDSTEYDVKLMKKRAHVLHKMLEGSVQRFDYSVLTPFLPPKQEYVIFVRLTPIQIKMYQYYLENLARRHDGRNGSLFSDFQELQRVWTHPYVLRLNAAKIDKANEKKRLEASDSEGSLKDFIDDGDASEASTVPSSDSDSDSDIECLDSDAEKKPVKMTRSARMNAKIDLEEPVPPPIETTEETAWWAKYIEENDFNDLRNSTKLMLLFGILQESEQIGDKLLVFSQSLYSLTLIEQFLNMIDSETQNDQKLENLGNHSGNWSLGLDYFRLDGSTSAENRSAWCKTFNNPTNTRARLFLISTRAGGLGINLTAANRVIIFDASWNPSHDVQSIFRIYRFGQKKPCYIYRFLAAGTMEEKIYNRQVTKLSLACRVVDEQQIERHYSNNDLAELYQFESYEGQSKTLALPKDRLLAEIFLKYKDLVYTYHEHDSLLENKEEEELDEEERKQAWLEYEAEKQGKNQMMNNMSAYNNMALNPFMNLNSINFPELESIKMLIQKDYPSVPPDQIETVARQAFYDMYRLVDHEAVKNMLNPYAVPGQNILSNLLNPGPAMPPVYSQQQNTYNVQNQLMHLPPQMNYTGVNHMPVYSGRGRPPKHLANMNMQAPMQMQAMQQAAMRSNPLSNNTLGNNLVSNPMTSRVVSNAMDDVQIIDPMTLPSASASNSKKKTLEE